jgi:hypothetical protein
MKPFSFTNSRGRTYYLHKKRRRDGRLIYVLGTSATNALSALPASLEVRENVNGRVSIRRHCARQITESEAEMLHLALARLRPFAYRVDVDGRAATIYASAADRHCFSESIEADFAEGFSQALKTLLTKRYAPELIQMFRDRRQKPRGGQGRYYPVMRFVLSDKRQRLFSVERVCFTGESSWIRLEMLPLSAALMKYLPHLGKNSFFDLL